MPSKVGVALFFLFLMQINHIVYGGFHFNTLNRHISLRYQNNFQNGNDKKTSSLTSSEKSLHQSVPKKYGPFSMTLPLDHFKNTSGGTFQNRYWVNSNFYRANGPVILYNVGEAAADSSARLVTHSTMAQLAEYLNGVLVIMEHRFYGSSGPNVKSFFDNTKDNLQAFTSKQAIADMAYLIKNVKFGRIAVPPVPKSKVIVYGCSYSGNLAAWAKEKYPEIFFAAVSSSAPVEASINFYQYFDPIMRYGPKSCISAMKNAISQIDHILFNGTEKEIEKLKRMFYAEKLRDQSFAELLMGDFSGQWQYGINSTFNAFDELVCSYFPNSDNRNSTKTIENNLKSYANYINHFTRYAYCDNDKSKALDDCLFESNFTITNDVSDISNDEAAWSWQTCLEFGYFQVSAPKNLPTIVSRKYNLSYFTNMCQKFFSKYGIREWPDVNGTNREYKGWEIQLNRTIWIDGEWDSWRELSVNNINLHRNFDRSNNQSISIIIPKSTHCANVAQVTDESPDYLKRVFMQQYKALKYWLATADH